MEAAGELETARSLQLRKRLPVIQGVFVMEEIKTNPVMDKPRWSKYLVLAAILVIVILVGFFAYRFSITPRAAPSPPGKKLISQSALEEKSGLRVTLIAVTAVGGMVDFRFKVMDVEKARKILQDGKLLPYLTVAGSNISLNPAPETLQDLKLENDLVYYILYSNTGNLVKPGTPVSVVIGDWQLEPIIAK